MGGSGAKPRLEIAGIIAGIGFGLLGLVVATLSFLNSREALRLTEATSRAHLVIASAALIAPSEAGKYLAVKLDLQNFGRAAAGKVSASFMHSEYPTPGSYYGLQGLIPPGFVRSITLADQYKWSAKYKEYVIFFIKLQYTDMSSGELHQEEFGYYTENIYGTPSSGQVELRPMVIPGTPAGEPIMVPKSGPPLLLPTR